MGMEKKKKTGTVRKGGGQPGNKNAEKWTEEKAMEIGRELIAWLEKGGPDNIFFEKFLVGRGLYRDMVVFLSEKYRSFSEVIKKAKQLQELNINTLAITNQVSVPISIFMLKNHHNYTDKVNHTGDVQSSINFQLVPRKPVKRKKK